MRSLYLLFVVLPIMSGCAGSPQVAERIDYDPPRWTPEPDLARKAVLHERATLAQVDDAGLLLYWSAQPWGDAGAGLRRYRASHNLADAPAWQGYLMASLAFKAAVVHRGESGGMQETSRQEELLRLDSELRRLAGAYEKYYDITGERGLIGRSMLPGYDEPEPLPWMIDESGLSDWTRSPHTGEWWHDDLAKNHLNLAVFGLAVPLALHRRGEIELSPQTERALRGALMPLVRRLVDDEYELRDSTNQPTQFSDIGPTSFGLPNGFQRAISLHLLASAAPYDDELAVEYERRLEDWTPGLAWSLEVSGGWTRDRGPWNSDGVVGHSDAQGLALALVSLFIQEERPEHRETFRRAVAGWWRFMASELNAPYAIAYAQIVEDDPAERGSVMAPIVADLRDFPPEKRLASNEELASKVEHTPGVVQPIHNRPVDANYWKASPYERIVATEHREQRWRAAGMDYLLAYWMGRYFDLIPAR